MSDPSQLPGEQRLPEWDSEDYEGDLAEPEPDTIGASSRTAKCLHCEQRIYEDRTHEWGWLHDDTDDPRCEAPPSDEMPRSR